MKRTKKYSWNSNWHFHRLPQNSWVWNLRKIHGLGGFPAQHATDFFSGDESSSRQQRYCNGKKQLPVSRHASEVIMVLQKRRIRASKDYAGQGKRNQRSDSYSTLLWKEIIGWQKKKKKKKEKKKTVTGVRIRNVITNMVSKLNAGIFLSIGHEPNSKLFTSILVWMKTDIL